MANRRDWGHNEEGRFVSSIRKEGGRRKKVDSLFLSLVVHRVFVWMYLHLGGGGQGSEGGACEAQEGHLTTVGGGEHVLVQAARVRA